MSDDNNCNCNCDDAFPAKVVIIIMAVVTYFVCMSIIVSKYCIPCPCKQMNLDMVEEPIPVQPAVELEIIDNDK